jgi:hypothetical protein
VPAQYTGPIVTQFGDCLHARLVAADPTVTPAVCHPAHAQVLPAAAHPVLASAGGTALRTDFASSLVRTLWFQLGVFVLSFLLMLGIPAGAGRHAKEGTGEPAAADRALAPAGGDREGATA